MVRFAFDTVEDVKKTLLCSAQATASHHPSSTPGRAGFLIRSARHESPARAEHELFRCGEVTCIRLTEREHTHALTLTEILQ